MKILFLSDDFPPYSSDIAGIIAYRLGKYFISKGHEVSVITTTRDKDLTRTTPEGIREYVISSDYDSRLQAYRSIYNPSAIKKVKKILEEVRPDVVNAHSVYFHLSYHSLKLAKKSGAKVVLTAHDAMLYSYGKVGGESKLSPVMDIRNFKWQYNPFRNVLIKYYLKYVDRVISVSDSLGRALENNGVERVSTVHNGINLDEWSVPNDELIKFKKLHGLENKKVVLFSGRLGGAKGGLSIIDVMTEVIKRVPEAILLIAGKKEGYGQLMRKHSEKMNISDHLVFTGWLNLNQMKVAYFASDVVVTPSLYLDPFPTVNLEAMAAKKPVVGTCFGGTPEVVIDNETGYIVDPNDTDLMASKIATLLKDQALAHKLGEAGYERLKKNFGLEEQANKYLNIFIK